LKAVVANWSVQQLAMWFRANTSLIEVQIRSFVDNGFDGADAINTNISSLDKLRTRVPTARFDEWNAIIGTPVNMATMYNFVFLNAAGGSMDGFLFAHTTTGQLILFAHQNKHTVGSALALTFEDIKQEVEKLQTWFNAWCTGVKPTTKVAKGSSNQKES
jgi:hypothetical protein